MTFAGASFDEWKKRGEDTDSIIADPRFRDPAHGDFTIPADSPAIALGFVPIDGRGIGLDRGHAQGALLEYLPHFDQAVATQSVPAAFPPPPPPSALPPLTVNDDFEDTPVGEKAVDAITSEQGDIPAARIRVSDQSAASGTHSLRFTDAPGQRNQYDPHLYYQPNYASGVAEGSFNVRMEAGAILVHEWRTGGNPYQTGPSLRIADGHLSASGRELMALPLGEWVHIGISAALGGAAHGRYDLTVTLPHAQEPRRFADLPCSERFTSLQWVGFVSDATSASVFYIDDVALRCAQAH